MSSIRVIKPSLDSNSHNKVSFNVWRKTKELHNTREKNKKGKKTPKIKPDKLQRFLLRSKIVCSFSGQNCFGEKRHLIPPKILFESALLRRQLNRTGAFRALQGRSALILWPVLPDKDNQNKS